MQDESKVEMLIPVSRSVLPSNGKQHTEIKGGAVTHTHTLTVQRGEETHGIINFEPDWVNATWNPFSNQTQLKRLKEEKKKREIRVTLRCYLFKGVIINTVCVALLHGLYEAVSKQWALNEDQTNASLQKLCSSKIHSLYHWMLNKAFTWQEIKKKNQQQREVQRLILLRETTTITTTA